MIQKFRYNQNVKYFRYDTSSQYGTRNGRPEERPITGDKSNLVTGKIY